MRENYFTKSMRKKSNIELENILEKKSLYTEEAIQAVIWELEDRNIIEKDEVLSYEENIETEEKEIKQNTSVLKDENESVFEDLIQPILYSKKTIQGFTIFFSTIFGAVLLMSNLKEMNKSKARTQVLVFGILYTILSYILLSFLPTTFFLTLLFNLIGYAILAEYFWNKNLGKYLKHRKKPIGKPLLISLIILAVVVFLQFLPMMIEV